MICAGIGQAALPSRTSNVSTASRSRSACGRFRSATSPRSGPRATWRCDRLTRRFVATRFSRRRARAGVVERPHELVRPALRARAASTGRFGRLTKIRIVDRWGLGGISVELCVAPPRHLLKCRSVASRTRPARRRAACAQAQRPLARRAAGARSPGARRDRGRRRRARSAGAADGPRDRGLHDAGVESSSPTSSATRRRSSATCAGARHQQRTRRWRLPAGRSA